MEVPEYQRPSAPNTEQRSSPPSPVIRKHWSGEKGKLELITGFAYEMGSRESAGRSQRQPQPASALAKSGSPG